MADWTFVVGLAIVLVFCIGEFPALGDGDNEETITDLPSSVEDFIDGVDDKIDDSVNKIKDFFQSAKRNVGRRVRRSWWSDNAGWIAPVGTGLLLGRDVSTVNSDLEKAATGTVPINQESLDDVKDSIEFLQTLANTASKALEVKQN